MGTKAGGSGSQRFLRYTAESAGGSQEQADLAWLIYDMVYDERQQRYNQKLTRTVYTQFKLALDKITISEAGSIEDFIITLQAKLDAKLEGASLATAC